MSNEFYNVIYKLIKGVDFANAAKLTICSYMCIS